MKPQTQDPVSLRCAHRTAGGRQCRLPASDAHSGLCPQHLAAIKQEQEADYFDFLTRNFHAFQTAQGINFSLGSLYELLGQNRISPRRAAVLAYISSLLLRTLPQIDADNAAGVKDPNLVDLEPLPAPTSVPEKVPVTDSTGTWNPSIRESDPNKKPS